MRRERGKEEERGKDKLKDILGSMKRRRERGKKNLWVRENENGFDTE